MITNIGSPSNLNGLGSLDKADQVGGGAGAGGWSRESSSAQAAAAAPPPCSAAPFRPCHAAGTSSTCSVAFALAECACSLQPATHPRPPCTSHFGGPQDKVREAFRAKQEGKKGGASAGGSKVRRARCKCGVGREPGLVGGWAEAGREGAPGRSGRLPPALLAPYPPKPSPAPAQAKKGGAAKPAAKKAKKSKEEEEEEEGALRSASLAACTAPPCAALPLPRPAAGRAWQHKPCTARWLSRLDFPHLLPPFQQSQSLRRRRSRPPRARVRCGSAVPCTLRTPGLRGCCVLELPRPRLSCCPAAQACLPHRPRWPRPCRPRASVAEEGAEGVAGEEGVLEEEEEEERAPVAKKRGRK